MSKKQIQEWLDREGARLLRSLQTPKARKAIERAFAATPKQVGRAAVQQHKKRQRTQQQMKQAYASLALATEKAASIQLKTLIRCFETLETIDRTLATAAADTLCSREHAAIWLGESHPELRGDSPYRAVASGRRDEVFRILNAIEHGIPL